MQSLRVAVKHAAAGIAGALLLITCVKDKKPTDDSSNGSAASAARRGASSSPSPLPRPPASAAPPPTAAAASATAGSMVRIPSGNVTICEGEYADSCGNVRVEVAPFEIDTTEVTVGVYA